MFFYIGAKKRSVQSIINQSIIHQAQGNFHRATINGILADETSCNPPTLLLVIAKTVTKRVMYLVDKSFKEMNGEEIASRQQWLDSVSSR